MATQTIAHAVFVHIPQSVPKTITQYELEEVILLRNTLRRLDRIEAGLKARLEAGAAVQEGVHVAELKATFRRNVGWKEVAAGLADELYGAGRGAAYCAEVLDGTVPARSVSLQVA